jgi:hypothetical protein
MSRQTTVRDVVLSLLEEKLAPLGYARKRAVFARPVGENHFHIELERHRKSDPSAPLLTLTVQVRFRRECEALGLKYDPFGVGVVSGWCRPDPEWVPVASEEEARRVAVLFTGFLESVGFPYLQSRLRELESEFPGS